MNRVRDGIIGVVIGDMLGVPVEFTARRERDVDPVTGIREGGPNEQPRGTWSDDTSMTLCLASALCTAERVFDLKTIAEEFLAWKEQARWTSHGYVFDIGQQTFRALNDIHRILESGDHESLEYLHYEAQVHQNGNGSLMRTLPLYFHIQKEGVEQNFKKIWQVSALTHPHIRAALSCLIYLVMIDELIRVSYVTQAYKNMQLRMNRFFTEQQIEAEEREAFARILEGNIATIDRNQIYSTGYVIHTLEASLWCLLTTDSFQDAVLKAVNLGEDTDTTGAVTGGLAGIFYGIDTVPEEWYETVAKLGEIEALCDRLDNKYK